jgi:class 3 adenylate cyclase
MSDESRDAVILFADLVGSARLSDVMPPTAYDTLVAAFQKTAKDVASRGIQSLERRGISEYDVDIRGDQLVLIAVVPVGKPAEAKGMDPKFLAAREVLKLAIKLGIRWFLSRHNKTRINDNATPYQIGVGIHFGPVVYKRHWRFPPGARGFSKEKAPEGFAINFGKRVESMSRFGCSSGIALSQSFVNLCKEAGFSLFLSNPLVGETKGFETREPIYELLGQELVPDAELDIKRRDIRRLAGARGRIENAFYRDPERTRWLLEMLVEAMFTGGYDREGRWSDGLRLALNAAEIVQKPAKFYFDAGRFAHKVGWHHGGDAPCEDKLLSAIAYHRTALADPDMQWAASDLAIVHTRFAAPYIEYDQRWQSKPTPQSVSHHLDEAKKMGTTLVEHYPNHYYSYYIRAITWSLRIQWLLHPESAPSLPLGAESSRDPEVFEHEFEQVERDLKSMRLLNDRPLYLYHCAEAEMEIARQDLPMAWEALEKAKEALERTESEEAYVAGFLQKGVMVPGLRPPPRSSFQKRFNVTQAKLDKLQKRLRTNG